MFFHTFLAAHRGLSLTPLTLQPWHTKDAVVSHRHRHHLASVCGNREPQTSPYLAAEALTCVMNALITRTRKFLLFAPSQCVSRNSKLCFLASQSLLWGIYVDKSWVLAQWRKGNISYNIIQSSVTPRERKVVAKLGSNFDLSALLYL